MIERYRTAHLLLVVLLVVLLCYLATCGRQHDDRRDLMKLLCDAQLTLFSAGGPQDGVWAPHLNIIPIPLLSEVRALLLEQGNKRQGFRP